MWFRAGQRQSSCLCRVCLEPTKTVARRSTTAATRRRKVTASDLFTACYTTILGTAAIIDAQNKEFKKQDLDEKLEKARVAVNALTTQNAAALAQAAGDDDADKIGSDFRSRIHSLSLSQQCAAIYGDQWKIVDARLTSSSRIDWVAIEKAITAEHDDPRIKFLEPTSAEQLNRVTSTVIDLVEELVAKVEIPTGDEIPQGHVQSAQVPGAYENEIWQDLEVARRSTQFPSFDYPHIDPELSTAIRSNLRQSLVVAIDRASTPQEMVARICHNLLVSTAPPSIMIYNTLIAGFNRVERQDLAQSVVDSVLKNTAGPDTQQTTLCLLNHFRALNDIRGIRTVAKRMRGVAGSPFYQSELPELPQRDVAFAGWLHDQDVFQQQPARYVRAAPTTKQSYDALIRAWLEAGNVDRATKKFVECIRRDVRAEPQTIHILLQNCAFGFESKAARKLVKGIAKHVENFIGILRQLTREAPIALAFAVFDNLHRILEISWDTTICDYGRNLDPFVDFTAKFKPWVFAQRLQLQARKVISDTEEIVKAFSLDQPLVDRLEAALNLFNDNSYSAENPTLWQRATKLSSVQSHYEHLAARTTQLSSQVQYLIIKLRTGLDFDPFEDLESTRFQEKDRKHVLADALQQVALQDTMTTTQVKVDLVAKLPDARQARAFQQAGVGTKMSIGNLTRFYGPKQRQLVHTHSSKSNGGIVAALEAELDDRLQTVRALLYGSLCAKRHRLLRWTYSNWSDIPLELLTALNIQKFSSPSPAKTSKSKLIHGQHGSIVMAESRLQPSSRAEPLPEGIEVSPAVPHLPHLRRKWNPPQQKTWFQPEGVSSHGWRISAAA
ncbi:leucine-rich PPR motif-containing protein [Microdochium nivale]|nr:leucine-rich PPR motif-containing protein [Microdochium nivale]